MQSRLSFPDFTNSPVCNPDTTPAPKHRLIESAKLAVRPRQAPDLLTVCRTLKVASSAASSSTFRSRVLIFALRPFAFRFDAFSASTRSRTSCIALRARSEMLRAPVAIHTACNAANSSSERRTLIERDRGLRTVIWESDFRWNSGWMRPDRSRQRQVTPEKEKASPPSVP